jgi:hypothetical protein
MTWSAYLMLGAPLLLEIITRAMRRRGQMNDSRLLNSSRRDATEKRLHSYKAGR